MRGKRDKEQEKAVSEAQGRQRGSCEGQGEVRWNAVTVDRGPVLVQVLQGPTGPTKKNDKNDECPAARSHQIPKIAAVAAAAAAAAIHYRARVCTLVLAGPINFRRFTTPTRPIYDYRDYS